MLKQDDEVYHMSATSTIIGKVKSRLPCREGDLYLVVDAVGLEYLMREDELKLMNTRSEQHAQ
jgi:hypothetical protein